MEKKHYLTLVIGILVILVLSFFFFYQKEQIQASPVALISSEWKAHFSSDIKLSSIRTGDVYVVNKNGKESVVEVRPSKNNNDYLYSNPDDTTENNIDNLSIY